MALNNISAYQQTPQFLEATRAQGRAYGYNPESSYHQAYKEGVPNTTPQVAFIPTTDQMELAQAYLSGRVNTGENIFAPKKTATQTQDARGAAWNGYTTPANNGTGELSPVLTGREDEIPDCPWQPYVA